MNFQNLLSIAMLGAVLGGAGCSHLDLAPGGSPQRVLTGTLTTGAALPAGAEVLVRVIVPTGATAGRAPASDLPVATLPTQAGEQILGEFVQKLGAPAIEPVPFRIEYEADDALLRRGLNIEARILFSGRVRFRTINAQVITATSAPYPQHLVLQAADR
jgi:uncharacterized lipoprotein YbaY